MGPEAVVSVPLAESLEGRKPCGNVYDVSESTHTLPICIWQMGRSTSHVRFKKLGTPTVGRSLELGILKRPAPPRSQTRESLPQTMDDTVCGPERLDISLISRARSYHGWPKIPSSFQVEAGKGQHNQATAAFVSSPGGLRRAPAHSLRTGLHLVSTQHPGRSSIKPDHRKARQFLETSKLFDVFFPFHGITDDGPRLAAQGHNASPEMRAPLQCGPRKLRRQGPILTLATLYIPALHYVHYTQNPISHQWEKTGRPIAFQPRRWSEIHSMGMVKASITGQERGPSQCSVCRSARLGWLLDPTQLSAIVQFGIVCTLLQLDPQSHGLSSQFCMAMSGTSEPTLL